METIETTHLIFGVCSLAAGYALFIAALKVLPKRLKRQLDAQNRQLIEEARKQASNVLKIQNQRSLEGIQILDEELEAEIEDMQESLSVRQQELDQRSRQLQAIESKLQNREKDLETSEEKVAGYDQQLQALAGQLDEQSKTLMTRLEDQAQSADVPRKEALSHQIIEQRKLQLHKVYRVQEEELAKSVGRTAHRTLARTLSRYWPEFHWPKHSNFVEVRSERVLDALAGDHAHILEQLNELAEISSDIQNQPGPSLNGVKVSGGCGVKREAARRALDEVLVKPQASWSKVSTVYANHLRELEGRAQVLGRQATLRLGVENIHPEIQRLIGHLNWRTSYRQNQYLHSVEVAKLAGVLACELGEDPKLAIRCGLLHDIGKALDYRIEGSHAVISGDYADRFGEDKLICDTVMSHHNDLVVESSMAFILKSADTLSGARPGARVNLEEGYQVRLSAIDEVVRGFPGVTKSVIMNGGREVHIEVSNKRVKDADLPGLSRDMARMIEEQVAFPGQIKVLVTRRFESVSVA